MSLHPRFHEYRAGALVSVYDERLGHWRAAKVVHANERLVTVVAGAVLFFDVVASPRFLRPIRLAYCRVRGAA